MARKGSATSTDRRAHGIANGYRSGLEESVGADLERRGVPFSFEKLKLEWTSEPERHTYTPDFVVETRPGKAIIIETKGYFTPADRKKMLNVKRCNPDLDIRLLFQRASTPIRKGSKTTYGMWATKHGFVWAEKVVPDAWLRD